MDWSYRDVNSCAWSIGKKNCRMKVVFVAFLRPTQRSREGLRGALGLKAVFFSDFNFFTWWISGGSLFCVWNVTVLIIHAYFFFLLCRKYPSLCQFICILLYLKLNSLCCSQMVSELIHNKVLASSAPLSFYILSYDRTSVFFWILFFGATEQF